MLTISEIVIASALFLALIYIEVKFLYSKAKTVK